MATTITVPSGGTGTVALTFSQASSAALAQSLLSAVYGAGANLFVGTGTTAPSTTPGAVNEYLITGTNSSVTVPAGYNVVVDAATGPVTISGNNALNESIVAGNGGFEYFAGTGTGTIIAGGGSATIASSATTGGGFAALGDATYTDFFSTGTVGGGGNAVLIGNATATISGSNATVFGSASGTSLIVNSGGANTVVAGTGATTIDANASGGLSFNQSAPLTFVASASTTLVTGGPSTVTGGPGASTYFSFGTSAFSYTNHGGNDTIGGLSSGPLSITGGPGGNLTLLTAAGLPTSTIVGGTGAETVDGAFLASPALIIGGADSTGSNLIIAGNSGADTIQAGSGTGTFIGSEATPPATDTFLFKSGLTGGNDTIFNFASVDVLALSGYGVAAEQAAIAAQKPGNNTVSITLPDKTSITIAGITVLPTSQTSLT